MKMQRRMPSINLLRKRFSYDAETGKIRYKEARGKRRRGDLAGYADAKGYVKISVNGNWIYAHRLAWALQYGRWPAAEIDHINRDPSDNRLCNLRDVSRSENMQNADCGKGWHYHRKRGVWQAMIRRQGVRTYLGSYSTEAEARIAYRRAMARPAPTPAPVQLDMLGGDE